MLYTARSVADRGTLAQLKNDFGHRNVSTDIMNCFNHAENFLRFVTEAHVVYLLLKLCDMEEIDDVPRHVDTLRSVDELQQYFTQLCERIVQHVWILPDITDVTAVADYTAENSVISDRWCICGEGTNPLHQSQ